MIKAFLCAFAGAAVLLLGGPAPAQTPFETAPLAAPSEVGSFYVIAHGGRHILGLDRLPIGLPKISSGFTSVEIAPITAQHESMRPLVWFGEEFDCGGGTMCREIRYRPASSSDVRDDWVLSVLKTDNPNGLAVVYPDGNASLASDTPVWRHIELQGPGVLVENLLPRLVLVAAPGVQDVYLIREYAWDASAEKYSLTDRVLANGDDPNRQPPLIWNSGKASTQSYRDSFYLLGTDGRTDWTHWRLKAYVEPCIPYTGEQCYWMENQSGNFCWVPSVIFAAPTKADCFALDSCDGGPGGSGGGCYKWTDCSTCAREPW